MFGDTVFNIYFLQRFIYSEPILFDSKNPPSFRKKKQSEKETAESLAINLIR